MIDIEVGRWYSYTGSLPSLVGRPVQILAFDDHVALCGWASGMERLLERSTIGEQVEDAIPGKTEPCMVCGGHERDEKNPCPNCRGQK